MANRCPFERGSRSRILCEGVHVVRTSPAGGGGNDTSTRTEPFVQFDDTRNGRVGNGIGHHKALGDVVLYSPTVLTKIGHVLVARTLYRHAASESLMTAVGGSGPWCYGAVRLGDG